MKNRKQLPSTSPNHSFFLWRITRQFLTAWVACWSLVIPAERKDENSFRRIHCSGFAIFSPLVEEKIYLRIPNSHVGLPATNFQAQKMQFKARSPGSTQAPVLGENLCLRKVSWASRRHARLLIWHLCMDLHIWLWLNLRYWVWFITSAPRVRARKEKSFSEVTRSGT